MKNWLNKILLPILLVLLPGSGALAEQTGFLYLNNFRQNIGLDYLYTGNQTDLGGGASSSSHRHRINETYGLDVDYFVYGPYLWKGRLSVETGLFQHLSSPANGPTQKTSGSDLSYHLSGTLFERKPTTFGFFVKSETAQVSRSFSGSYTLMTDSVGANLKIKNQRIPFEFRYQETESDTDGLAVDRHRQSRSLLFRANHHLSSLSETALTLAHETVNTDFEGSVASTHSEWTRLNLKNILRWQRNKKRRNLTTILNYRHASGEDSRRQLDWSENLQIELGPALESSLLYRKTFQDLLEDTLHSDDLGASLKHRFVASTTTEVRGGVRENRQGEGNEQIRQGTFLIDYVNHLPQQGHLHLNFSQGISRVDRHFDSATLLAPNETYSATLSAPIMLSGLNVVPESIVVEGIDTDGLAVTYLAELDYRVDTIGERTFVTISPQSGIEEGAPLSISYQFLTDAQVAYEQTVRQWGGSLSFWENRFRIYGQHVDTRQTLLSGSDAAVGLRDSRNLLLGTELNRPFGSATLEYRHADSEYEVQQQIYAALGAWGRLGPGRANLGLSSTSTQTDVRNLDAKTRETRHISYSLYTGYRTSPFRVGLLSVNSRYSTIDGDFLEREDLSLDIDYQFNYGKFVLTLQAGMDWNFLASQTIREDNLHLKVRRYF